MSKAWDVCLTAHPPGQRSNTESSAQMFYRKASKVRIQFHQWKPRLKRSETIWRYLRSEINFRRLSFSLPWSAFICKNMSCVRVNLPRNLTISAILWLHMLYMCSNQSIKSTVFICIYLEKSVFYRICISLYSVSAHVLIANEPVLVRFARLRCHLRLGHCTSIDCGVLVDGAKMKSARQRNRTTMRDWERAYVYLTFNPCPCAFCPVGCNCWRHQDGVCDGGGTQRSSSWH